jgi:transcription elongation factor Elf1
MVLLLETSVECPHCGEEFPTMVDTSQGGYSAVEDCAVCCRPMQLDVDCEPGEIFSVAASAQ